MSTSSDRSMRTNLVASLPALEDKELLALVLDQLTLAQQREESLAIVLKRLQTSLNEEETLLRDAQEYIGHHQATWTSLESSKPHTEESEEADEESVQLEELEASVHALEQQAKASEAKLAALNELEANEFKELEGQIIAMLDDQLRRQLREQEQYDRFHTQRIELEKKLSVLTQTDALNESFFIWHEGYFGTINGQRLGCLPDEPVEWNEINAAFGFAALLLESLARSVSYSFCVWSVLPRGSQSLMVNVSNPSQTLDLYCKSTWLWKTSFNAGISAFADCVDELGAFAKAEDPSALLPYKIETSKIGGLSVHYSNSMEWTRAMKFLLTDIKWLTVWVVRRRDAAASSATVN